MDKKTREQMKHDLNNILGDLGSWIDGEPEGYEANRLQDAFDLLGEAIDQFRYVDHPEAFNTEVLERRKKMMAATDKKIQDLEKQIMVEHTENESLKMAISRANDTIKEQTGAIKMLKELLKEM